jgi:hypothetical protein
MISPQWFWDRVDMSAGPDACWPWTGQIRSGRSPYGRLHVFGRTEAAHRFALVIAKGPAPRMRPFACHTCDNPPCCNPAHLWWGSAQENVDDCVEKGRKRFLHRRLFDRSEALRLRTEGWSYSMLAERYGINQASIGKAMKPLGAGGQIARYHPLRTRSQ